MIDEFNEDLKHEIIVVIDPMCSWCWGFSPALTEMAETYQDQAPVWLMAGGLRPLTEKPMNDDAKAEIRHHWEDVHEVSGQPFDFSFFERNGFVYDTEPACRALVAMRRIKPEAAPHYLATMHQAFYAQNRDITNETILSDLAANEGVNKNDFIRVFSSRQTIYRTAGDFHRAHAMGARGFPTVVLRTGEKLELLCAGFRPFDQLKPAIDQWLAMAPARQVEDAPQ
ncbi:MAG: DsbA family protein [Rhodospirillales bacterium]